MDKEWKKEPRPQNKHLKVFKKWETASSESKSAWRARRRQAMKIMKEMIEYQDLTPAQFEEYLQKNKKTMNLWKLITAKRTQDIMKDKNMMKYWLDKHIPNAPTQTEISWVDWDPLLIDISTADTTTLLKLLGR